MLQEKFRVNSMRLIRFFFTVEFGFDELSSSMNVFVYKSPNVLFFVCLITGAP